MNIKSIEEKIKKHQLKIDKELKDIEELEKPLIDKVLKKAVKVTNWEETGQSKMCNVNKYSVYVYTNEGFVSVWLPHKGQTISVEEYENNYAKELIEKVKEII